MWCRAGLLACVIWLASAPAAAWNESGHMQIALLSYDSLDRPSQLYLSELLTHHPRFAEDFVARMPPGLSPEDRSRWLFAWAATWPDIARSQSAYHHGRWHYVNLPLAVIERVPRRAMSAPPRLVSCVTARRRWRASASVEPQGSEPTDIVGALARVSGALGDPALPPSERALALTWLLHLVGDAHQPLHAVALFTSGRFADGDRGGNEIVVQGRGKLHQLWDDLLGDDPSFAAVVGSASRLRGDPELLRAGRAARVELSIDRWLDESCELARRAVYVPRVLSAVEQLERRRGRGKPKVVLGSDYVEAAGKAARRRAAQAAARLTATLEAVLLARPFRGPSVQ